MKRFKENFVPILVITAIIIGSIISGMFMTYKYIEHTFDGAEYSVNEELNIITIEINK